MGIQLACFLVVTLTTTGLAALAASRARGHWFLRTAAFLGVLAPLLFVPAYEPFIALSLEGATIATGVWVARRQRSAAAAAKPQARRGPRFSMATLLLAMVVCGGAAAIAPRVPTLNRYAWQSVAIIGVFSGMAVLLGAWAATRRGWRVLPAAAAALLAALLVSVVPAWFDWLMFAFLDFGQWPPSSQSTSSAQFLGVTIDRPLRLWFIALPAISLMVFLVVGLWRRVLALAPQRMGARWRRPARALAGLALVGVMLLNAVPSGGLLFEVLLAPEPIPVVTLPRPNAYDELKAAGDSLEHALINSGSFDWDKASHPDRERAVDEVKAAVAQARLGLQHEFMVPIDFKNEDTGFPEIQSMRNLARALNHTGQLAQLNRETAAALEAYLDTIEFGFECRRGGLIVQGLVGTAITGIGSNSVFDIVSELSADQCHATMERCESLMAASEPYASIEYRDDVWEQHAYGWFGRLYQFLSYKAGESYVGEYEWVFVMETARTRLLIAHLALQAYLAEGDDLPASWASVEAAGLPALGIDPWDPNGGALRYRLADGSFILYSVGPNGADDGGQAPGANVAQGMLETDDLRLDFMFAP